MDNNDPNTPNTPNAPDAPNAPDLLVVSVPDRRRKPRTRWERFWRDKKQKVSRNTTTQATLIAVVMCVIVLILGFIIYLGLFSPDWMYKYRWLHFSP